MLGIAKKIQEHIEGKLREMLQDSLNDLRQLERVHDATAQRQFLSGKIAAYEEILKLLLFIQ